MPSKCAGIRSKNSNQNLNDAQRASIRTAPLQTVKRFPGKCAGRLCDRRWRLVASWTYSVAGFSSRSYLHILGHLSEAGTTTPELLARDYDSIIAFAEQRLGLPASTPVILVGVSRGAGLSVVAAGAGIMHRPVAGLLAVALIKEEEHVLHSQRRGNKSDSESRLSQVAVDTYLYLNRLDPFPLMVLQSTHDGYLSAGDARNLFGPDSEMRKLRAIEATNHSFHNGCQTLNQEAENALRWIVSLLRK
jgi:pimeloyl-ACP methyl ester carboxylesterase